MGSDGFLTMEKVRDSTNNNRYSYIVSQKDLTEADRGKDSKI